jgi:hypothetical protein
MKIIYDLKTQLVTVDLPLEELETLPKAGLDLLRDLIHAVRGQVFDVISKKAITEIRP